MDMLASLMAAQDEGQTINFETGGENGADLATALQSLMMTNAGEGDEGDTFDFGNMMQGMMQQFVSKQTFYEPCKQIIPNYDEYLANHPELSEEDRTRFTAQQEVYKELVHLFETDENNHAAIFEVMSKLEELGDTPPEVQIEEPELSLEQPGCSPQ